MAPVRDEVGQAGEDYGSQLPEAHTAADSAPLGADHLHGQHVPGTYNARWTSGKNKFVNKEDLR